MILYLLLVVGLDACYIHDLPTQITPIQITLEPALEKRP